MAQRAGNDRLKKETPLTIAGRRSHENDFLKSERLHQLGPSIPDPALPDRLLGRALGGQCLLAALAVAGVTGATACHCRLFVAVPHSTAAQAHIRLFVLEYLTNLFKLVDYLLSSS